MDNPLRDQVEAAREQLEAHGLPRGPRLIRQFLTVVATRAEHHGDRRVIEVRWLPLHPRELPIPATLNRISALAHFAYSRYDALPIPPVGSEWSLSIVVRDDVGKRLVGRSRVEPLASQFNSLQEITDRLPVALSSTIFLIAQSNASRNLEDFLFQLYYDRRPIAYVHGKVPKLVVGACPKGLAGFKALPKICGLQCVVYAMALNPKLVSLAPPEFSSWFEQHVSSNNGSTVQRLRDSMALFKRACSLIAALAHISEDGPWYLVDDTLKFLQWATRLRLVIYNRVSRQKMQDHQGTEYNPTDANDSTILLDCIPGHLSLIKSPFAYFGRSQKNLGERFCRLCLQFYRRVHVCPGLLSRQCDRCTLVFNNREECEAHQFNGGSHKFCHKCRKRYYNQHCLKAHTCKSAHVELCDRCTKPKRANHQCGTYKCFSCGDRVEQGHRCYIQPLKEPEEKTPEEAGKEYWAFDVESMFTPGPNDSSIHTVNLVVAVKCFTDGETQTFRTLDTYLDWIETLPPGTMMLAHNLSGYDGRLVFEKLFDERMAPTDVLWRGSRIIRMKYHNVVFADTLLHWPCSLAGLPRMFGLDTSQYKKGHFPYLFNVPEHQNYVGPMPPAHYYAPETMPTEKKAEFERWYAEQDGRTFDFQLELYEYCLSDTRILAASIEAYMRAQMAIKPLDPFSCITIASYAMRMYRTYYMPPFSIGRLTNHESALLAPGMHGGRTDARCLYREWPAPECGVYGKYLDIQSLYPTVQFFDPLPAGTPEIHGPNYWVHPSQRELEQLFGFACVDIEPTRRLFHPIIVDLDPRTGLLVADLRPKKNIVIASPELHLAMRHGYRVTKVHWSMHFQPTYDMFRSYFREFLRLKIEASGPQDEEYCAETQRRLGILLRLERMIANAALRAGAKLLCNSLWGKLAESIQHQQWEIFSSDDHAALQRLELQWMDGQIEIAYSRTSERKRQMAVIYTDRVLDERATQAMLKKHRNIAVASMITSHARVRLWTELDKLGERVMYHDTDSIIYEHRDGQYDIPVGKYLGEWADECKGVPMTRFVALGPKSYAYELANGETHTKVKGITLSAQNQEVVTIDTMLDLLLGKIDQIKTQTVMFQYDRETGIMFTRDCAKTLTETPRKGDLDRDSWIVYPFGWNDLPE